MMKSGKHCVKRRNCLFWAISCFVTMFSKSHLLQRHQKASRWGKGLNFYSFLEPGLNTVLTLVSLHINTNETYQNIDQISWTGKVFHRNSTNHGLTSYFDLRIITNETGNQAPRIQIASLGNRKLDIYLPCTFFCVCQYWISLIWRRN